jgi:hypothetical protein
MYAFESKVDAMLMNLVIDSKKGREKAETHGQVDRVSVCASVPS